MPGFLQLYECCGNRPEARIRLSAEHRRNGIAQFALVPLGESRANFLHLDVLKCPAYTGLQVWITGSRHLCRGILGKCVKQSVVGCRYGPANTNLVDFLQREKRCITLRQQFPGVNEKSAVTNHLARVARPFDDEGTNRKYGQRSGKRSSKSGRIADTSRIHLLDLRTSFFQSRPSASASSVVNKCPLV